MKGRCRLRRALRSGFAGVVLAGACVPVHAACTSLQTTGSNSITATIQFGEGSTTASFNEATGTIQGIACSSGNTLFAGPFNGSTSGAGTALRAGGGAWNYQLRDSANAAWGNQNGNKLGVSGPDFSVQFRVANGASNSGFPLAGTYTDTVQVALAQGNTPTGDSFSLAVNIVVPDQCVLTGISPVNLEYTSFGPSASQEMKFTAACNTPYSISLNDTAGSMLGLNYSLSLTPSGAGLSANPAGTEHTVLVTIGAGQAGTCANSATVKCTDARTHQMTVTY
jgi:hypothetical protein